MLYYVLDLGDAQYRQFLGKYRKGFYIMGGLRYSYLHGYDYNSHKVQTDNKFGMTFGIGYRIFSKMGWYWGTSLFAGRYFKAQDLYLEGAYDSESKMIWDFELLKIGRTF